ncbi:MAG: hypothetical protein U9N57_13530 [Pseudomonadota bacterium]|nr:hypothetical protein [Pseudomonadota bacterium]
MNTQSKKTLLKTVVATALVSATFATMAMDSSAMREKQEQALNTQEKVQTMTNSMDKMQTMTQTMEKAQTMTQTAGQLQTRTQLRTHDDSAETVEEVTEVVDSSPEVVVVE